MARAIQVSLAKKNAITDGEGQAVDPAVINNLVTAQVQNIAVTIGAVILLKKGADTLSELILIAGKKYI